MISRWPQGAHPYRPSVCLENGLLVVQSAVIDMDVAIDKASLPPIEPSGRRQHPAVDYRG